MSAITVSGHAQRSPGGRPGRPRRHLSLVVDAAAPRPALRLTRRGAWVLRLLSGLALAFAGIVLVLLGSVLSGGTAEAGDEVGPRVATAEHVVLPGETLWGIASAWAPDQDPREVIDQIVELNALPGAEILAGQTISLPDAP